MVRKRKEKLDNSTSPEINGIGENLTRDPQAQKERADLHGQGQGF
jgi:hypothetical protein